jgi:adenylate kinase
MITLLMGPQGSGKGTQGEMLSKDLGIPLIGTGALLRAEIATGSDLGKKIKMIIDPGNLVPPELATELIVNRLKQDDVVDGALIDGYPRDPDQLRLMFEHFTPDAALVIDLDDDTAVSRLGGRWMCKDGHIWNEKTNPPAKSGICDHDDFELYQRNDDKEDAIRKRLAIYHEDTEPLIAAMEERGVAIHRVDGSGSIENVAKLVSEKIRSA